MFQTIQPKSWLSNVVDQFPTLNSTIFSSGISASCGAGDPHRAVIPGAAGSAVAPGGRGAPLPVGDRSQRVAGTGEGGKVAAREKEDEEDVAAGDLDVAEQGWLINVT